MKYRLPSDTPEKTTEVHKPASGLLDFFEFPMLTWTIGATIIIIMVASILTFCIYKATWKCINKQRKKEKRKRRTTDLEWEMEEEVNENWNILGHAGKIETT